MQATKPDMAEVVEQASKFFGGGDTHEMKMGRPEAAALYAGARSLVASVGGDRVS